MKPIDSFVEEARSRLDRVDVADLEVEVAAGGIVVDIRPAEQRERDGELPGAMIIDRNVLEWRLSPSSSARIVNIQQGQRVIIVCNEGYQSILAAATLQELGVIGATDLIGGFQAYLAAGRKGVRGSPRSASILSRITSNLIARQRKPPATRRPK